MNYISIERAAILQRKLYQKVDPFVHQYSSFFKVKSSDVIESHTPPFVLTQSGVFREVLTPEIHFSYFSGGSAEKFTCLTINSKAYISMIFSINGQCTIIKNGSNEVLAELAADTHCTLYIPEQETIVEWKPENNAELFFINVAVDYFNRFISDEQNTYSEFKRAISQNQAARTSRQGLLVNAQIKNLLHSILKCPHKEHFKRLFIRSKVIELIMHQMEQNEIRKPELAGETISDKHMEMMLQTKEIIMANLDKPCTIIDLAALVGTNDCYLKKQFKQVFGITVYGFLHRERMEKSREMLLEGRKKISDIARLAGYRQASHFTSAFKKYFGYLPSKLRIVIFSLLNESLPLIETGIFNITA